MIIFGGLALENNAQVSRLMVESEEVDDVKSLAVPSLFWADVGKACWGWGGDCFATLHFRVYDIYTTSQMP